jgi:hypothetical protein
MSIQEHRTITATSFVGVDFDVLEETARRRAEAAGYVLGAYMGAHPDPSVEAPLLHSWRLVQPIREEEID